MERVYYTNLERRECCAVYANYEWYVADNGEMSLYTCMLMRYSQ